VLPVEDVAVSAHVEKSFKRQGMTILTSHSVSALVPDWKRAVLATIDKPDGSNEDIEFTHAIVAIGILPNTENIGIEALGVATERGHVVIDGFCRTSVPGIWAIGDIVGAPWLAHKASHEAVIAVEAIAGLSPHPLDPRSIPGCTYSRPQVASVGLTEEKAKAAGYEVKTGSFPLIANGKAIALGDPDGFVKTVFDAKSGDLLGAHMVGAEVTEMIQGFAVALQTGATFDDLARVVFPHPTISESMHESVLAAHGRAIHI
jgi:dihydrolipoamide dehydrogenase